MQVKAQDLYERMTDYNTFLFTFLWCDLTQELARVHKNIQRNDLQISDVGRSITLLCIRLKDSYPLDSEIPISLPWIDGRTSYIMKQFWGKDYLTGMFNLLKLLLNFQNWLHWNQDYNNQHRPFNQNFLKNLGPKYYQYLNQLQLQLQDVELLVEKMFPLHILV